MRAMKKRWIENNARSGLDVYGEWVARVSRDKRTLTLRHAWPEDTCATVWYPIWAAAKRLACEVAAATGRDVEIYSHDGVCLAQIGFEP